MILDYLTIHFQFNNNRIILVVIYLVVIIQVSFFSDVLLSVLSHNFFNITHHVISPFFGASYTTA